VILAGDHIYKMNYARLVEHHKQSGADLTVGALPVAVAAAARQFGIVEVDAENRVVGFEEKPARPKPIPGDPQRALASMGIYMASTRFLFEQLCLDATRHGSRHDFGHDLIPALIDSHRVYAYPFMDENRKTEAYWRDVGTLDAYFDANMDLISVDPQLNMYDADWPIRTFQPNLPPPKFVFAEKGQEARRGQALDSIVCQGSIVSGGQLERTILGPDSRINSYAQVVDSILFEGVNVGRHAKIRRAIIDKGVHVPSGMEIGFDHDRDRGRGFTVSETGLTVPSARKKSPRKRHVPGGRRTRHISGSDWTLRNRRGLSRPPPVGRSAVCPKRAAGLRASGRALRGPQGISPSRNPPMQTHPRGLSGENRALPGPRQGQFFPLPRPPPEHRAAGPRVYRNPLVWARNSLYKPPFSDTPHTSGP